VEGCWLQIDLYVAAAGLLVGFTVGLTGMGGGALMTPLLVLLFKVQPLAAVSSDLVAAVIMKPVGGGVHLRRGTVNFGLVRWLMVGSVPAAFVGVLVLRQLGDGAVVQGRIKQVLGVALLVAATSIAAKGLLQVRATRRARELASGGPVAARPFQLRPLPTVLIGVVGGLVVGMTSVGSGSLMIVLLLVLYPMLRFSELVGTDLVQAVPLVASAAAGHLLFGDFKLDLTASLLIGSIPGVYLGARLSSGANDAVIRPILALVLVASGLKLLGVNNLQMGVLVLILLFLRGHIVRLCDVTGDGLLRVRLLNGLCLDQGKPSLAGYARFHPPWPPQAMAVLSAIEGCAGRSGVFPGRRRASGAKGCVLGDLVPSGAGRQARPPTRPRPGLQRIAGSTMHCERC
jgi:uncharacterized membrane protein YfcA